MEDLVVKSDSALTECKVSEDIDCWWEDLKTVAHQMATGVLEKPPRKHQHWLDENDQMLTKLLEEKSLAEIGRNPQRNIRQPKANGN